MDFFPQLSTGNSIQYPIKKTQVFRTATVTSEDGRCSKIADTGSRAIEWEIQFAGLTPSEWAGVANHFATAEGRLNSFPFLDGSDNLLKWSEKLSDPAWTVDPLLQVTEGAADPHGGTSGLSVHNTGTAWQGFTQTLAAPAAFTYTFSLMARSDSATHMRVAISGNSQQVQREFVLDQSWRQYVVTGSLPGTELTVDFGVLIDPGSQAGLYGLQAEPQMGASRYKRTTAMNGLHPNTRYGQDELKLTSDRPDSYATTIRLISREGF